MIGVKNSAWNSIRRSINYEALTLTTQPPSSRTKLAANWLIVYPLNGLVSGTRGKVSRNQEEEVYPLKFSTDFIKNYRVVELMACVL
ncbi:hypothetical protein AVEN_108741-1 [Araneus ventricosus]|uniref:Uncharacterized protein n=1 Tax=Araneus ventricosus TaxID=182803 RepID=A0A4Y2FEW1_ARAVE|nr:hypothetical protein AVEN_108741-1 [Araneus ventricosus]